MSPTGRTHESRNQGVELGILTNCDFILWDKLLIEGLLCQVYLFLILIKIRFSLIKIKNALSKSKA